MHLEPRWKNGTQRRKVQAKLRSECRPCWICRAFGRTGTINYALRFPHPYSFVLDELVPVSKYWMGGYATPEAAALDYANLAAAHKCCNEWRNNKTVEEVLAIAKGKKRGRRPPGQHETSRDWLSPKGG